MPRPPTLPPLNIAFQHWKRAEELSCRTSHYLHLFDCFLGLSSMCSPIFCISCKLQVRFRGLTRCKVILAGAVYIVQHHTRRSKRQVSHYNDVMFDHLVKVATARSLRGKGTVILLYLASNWWGDTLVPCVYLVPSQTFISALIFTNDASLNWFKLIIPSKFRSWQSSERPPPSTLLFWVSVWTYRLLCSLILIILFDAQRFVDLVSESPSTWLLCTFAIIPFVL